MPAASGTSQCPMSEPSTARRRAPPGLVLGIVGPDRRGIVRLAAEVEAFDEQLFDVGDAFNLASGPVVGRILGAELEHDAMRQVLQLLADAFVAAALEQAQELGPARLGRIDQALDRPLVALLPAVDQLGIERAGPARAAFEELELEPREPPRHPAEEQRAAQDLAGFGKAGGLVEDVVARGSAPAGGGGGAVRDQRHFQFLALGPERIVVIGAVDPERVEAVGRVVEFGVLAVDRRDRPRDRTDHRHLEA